MLGVERITIMNNAEKRLNYNVVTVEEISVAYGGCEVMKRQVEIRQIKVQNKISYADAVKMVNITGERRYEKVN